MNHTRKLYLKYHADPTYWERFFGRDREDQADRAAAADELERLANLPDDQNPGIQITYHP